MKKYFTVEVTGPLTNNSTVSATSITLGKTVTLKGAATGGKSPYKYAYYYKQNSQEKWTIAKDYSTTTSVTITPAKATTYEVCIKVKDSAGTEEKVYKTVKVTDTALKNTSSVSATSIVLGKTVTLKGAATGGTTPYKYAYYYKQTSQDKWTTAKDYSTTTSVTITPAKATTYEVCIKVKDNKGTEEKKYFTVKVTNNALQNTSKLSATSTTLGSSITAKGSATGGTAPYKYAYLYKQTSQEKWTTAKDYSTSTSVVITPAKATTYEVCIKVKDSTGTEVKKYLTLKVTG